METAPITHYQPSDLGRFFDFDTQRTIFGTQSKIGYKA